MLVKSRLSVRYEGWKKNEALFFSGLLSLFLLLRSREQNREASLKPVEQSKAKARAMHPLSISDRFDRNKPPRKLEISELGIFNFLT